jgi:hypothetical protein
MALASVMILALASILALALASTRPATIELPVRSLKPASRYIVTGSGEEEEKRKARRESLRKYREKNRDHFKQYDKLYYDRNKAAIVQQQKVYKEKNKDVISQQQKVYRDENQDAIKQYKKVYYDEIKSVIKQERNLEREKGILSNRQSIAQHPSHAQHLLSEEEHDALYHRILHEEKREIFEGLTLAQAIDSGKWTFYFGASKVLGTEDKLVCLSSRATKFKPVLLLADGTRMKNKFIRSQLGVVVGVLHSSRLVFNTLQLVWRLQETYRDLPFGHQRLNRSVGLPAYKAAGEIDDETTLCSLYLNCFPVTSQDTDADTVAINGILTQINH